jgi:hypothetical protein
VVGKHKAAISELLKASEIPIFGQVVGAEMRVKQIELKEVFI